MNKILLIITMVASSQVLGGFLGDDIKDLNAGSSYNYYVFASEWVGSVCLYNDCIDEYVAQVNPQFFNIHGLWPQTKEGDDPSGCSTINYDDALLDSSVTGMLPSRWSGLYNNSTGFHSHEWEKHGRCWNQNPVFVASSASKNPVNEFFSTVVWISQKIHIFEALQSKGVTPSTDEIYHLQDFENAIKSAFGISNVQINCNYKDGTQYLDSIYLCLDLQYNIMNCPNDAPSNCNANKPINYKPFSASN